MYDYLKTGVDAIRATINSLGGMFVKIEKGIDGYRRVKRKLEVAKEVEKLDRIALNLSCVAKSNIGMISSFEVLESLFSRNNLSEFDKSRAVAHLYRVVGRALDEIPIIASCVNRIDSKVIVFDPTLFDEITTAINHRERLYHNIIASEDYATINRNDVKVFKEELYALYVELRKIRNALVAKYRLANHVALGFKGLDMIDF